MPAYIIPEVIIRDEPSVDAYKPIASASIAEFGGRYLARDAVPAAIEGSFDPKQRIVVVEFDSPETARAWYESPSYRRALEAADGALDRRLFIVAGL